MMSRCRRYGFHPAVWFFLATWLVALLSWISDIYGVYVMQPDTGETVRIQSLLSAEGVRWWLRSMVQNFTRFACPGQVTVAAFGVGLACHAFAGYRPHSHKMRRAMMTALFMAGIYAALALFLAFSSGGILRGINGEITLSGAADGVLFLLSLVVGLTGITYGVASDRYRKGHNLLQGLTFLMPFLSIYFVISFFSSQLFACLEFARLDQFVAMWWEPTDIPWRLLYGLPLLLACVQYWHQRPSRPAK